MRLCERQPFSMRNNDVIRLRHMPEAAREAVSFAAGKTPDDLHHDRLLTLALLKSVEIIGALRE
jgi:uncharacterized protein with HEPN domain